MKAGTAARTMRMAQWFHWHARSEGKRAAFGPQSPQTLTGIGAPANDGMSSNVMICFA
jgi:hypothetical protein